MHVKDLYTSEGYLFWHIEHHTNFVLKCDVGNARCCKQTHRHFHGVVVLHGKEHYEWYVSLSMIIV
jgi:hypothetical protein